MKQDDFIFGCRSAIQKAIRRCDLDLAYTTFNTLWAIKEHKQWLKWRLTAIIMDDCWPFIGELAKFFADLKETPLKDEAEEQAWRKIIYRMVVAPKQKDAVALLWRTRHEMNNRKRGKLHPEMKQMMEVLKDVPEDADPSDAAALLRNQIVDSIDDLTQYEKDALILLEKRTRMGGMLGDRQCCLAMMILIASRRLSQDDVDQAVKVGVEQWKEKHQRTTPTTVDLPWGAFDMHTQVGKIVMSSYLKKHGSKLGIPREKLSHIWFELESNFTPDENITYSKIKLSPDVWECMWHQPLLDALLTFGDRTRAQVEALWNEDMMPKIRNSVEWWLEKRENS